MNLRALFGKKTWIRIFKTVMLFLEEKSRISRKKSHASPDFKTQQTSSDSLQTSIETKPD